TSHLVCHHVKRAACNSTAGQSVLQNTQGHAFAASINTQFGHVGDRDATVFRDHKRLSFSGEAGHFTDDRFFLTAIKTQGLLLKKRTWRVPRARSCCSDQLFWKISICSGIAICVGVSMSLSATDSLTNGLGWPGTTEIAPAHHIGSVRKKTRRFLAIT